MGDDVTVLEDGNIAPVMALPTMVGTKWT